MREINQRIMIKIRVNKFNFPLTIKFMTMMLIMNMKITKMMFDIGPKYS